MGIDFTMIPNKGPKILNPIANRRDVEGVKLITDAENQLPFIGQTLRVLHSWHRLSYVISCFNIT